MNSIKAVRSVGKRVRTRTKAILTATDCPIQGDQLRQAMVINIITGSGAMIWFSVCAPFNLFNVYFKNYLGGTAFDLGILVSITQLSSLFQLFSVFIYGKLKTRKVFWGVCNVISRMYGFVLAGISFAVARGQNSTFGVKIIIGALAISWILSMISSTGWWTWQTDLYPKRIRATFFGRRSAILNAVSMIWFFTVVIALDTLKFIDALYIYTVVFIIGALAGMADILFHVFIPEPRRKDHTVATGWNEFIEPLRNSNFMRYAIGIGMWSFSVNIAMPFLAPYITDKDGIGAPNTWLGIISAVTQAFWILTVGKWGKMMDRFGRKPVVVFSALSPLAWVGYLFMTNGNYIYLLPVLAMIGGLLGPGFGEGNMQLLLTITPDKNRIAFVAWYTTLIGLISSGGAILGGKLSDHFKDFHYCYKSLITINAFNIIAMIALVMVIFSVWLINRVEEEGSKPVPFLIKKIWPRKMLYRIPAFIKYRRR